MDFNDIQIIPPLSWDKFEELCLDVFKAQWSDPYAQRNGRRGQPQHGVDVWGNPQHAGGAFHGVQCKGKDGLYGAAVSIDELEAEVTKALEFVPRLQCFLLVTTAPKDATLEKAARLISERHQRQGLFSVKAFGWEDLRNRIADSDEVMTKHYPDQAPRAKEMLAKLKSIDEKVVARNVVSAAFEAETSSALARHDVMFGQILNFVQAAATPKATETDPAQAILQARIDDARDLMRENQPGTALRQFDRLIHEHWDTASGSSKFRLLTNRGAALFNLGRNEEGARACVDAFPFAPDDPRAIVHAAQGYFFLGDASRARTMLDDLLSRQRDNDDALALRIAVAVDEDDVTDPWWLVTDPGNACWNVVLSVARWYRHRGLLDESMTAFRRVEAAQPERLDVMAEVASGTLEYLFRNPGAIFADRVDATWHDELRGAVDTLSRVWDGVRRTEVRESFAWCVVNLCSGLRILSDYETASTRLVEALDVAPGDPYLLRQKALVEAALGEHEQLLLTLDELNPAEPETRLLRAETLDVLKRTMEALEALGESPMKGGQRVCVAAANLRVKLLLDLSRREEALATAMQVTDAFPDDALARLVVSEFYRRSGRPDEAVEQARSAAALLTEEIGSHSLETVTVAESLARFEDWNGAADLLAGAGDPTRDSETLRLRVQVLFNADRRRELRELLSAMPPPVASLPVFAKAAAWLFWLSGDHPNAMSSLDTYLGQVPDDLGMRLMWLDLAEGQGDGDAISGFLSGNVDNLLNSGRTRELISLARFMARHGDPLRAADLGYHTLRKRWTEPEAHLGFFGLMLASEHVRPPVAPVEISADVAFTVQDETGQRNTFIVETASDIKVELNEISSTSRLASAAAGLKVGDTVKVNDSGLVPEQLVVEVTHKYIGLLHRSMREFGTLFPDNNALIGMSVDPAHPERIVEIIRPALEARSANVRETLEQYRSGNLPIAFAASRLGVDPVDGWYALRQEGVPIDVCLGSGDEQEAAAALLSPRPPLILDAMTFWIAGVLDVLDTLTTTFGALGLTANTIGLLAERQRSAIENARREHGVMFEQDGLIGFAKPTTAEKQKTAALSTRLLHWARDHAQIIPAIPERDLPPIARQLAKMSHSSVIDTISAASGSRRTLLCEDGRLRRIAAELGVSRSAWLHSALRVCFETNSMRQASFLDAQLKLYTWKHHFTGLSAMTLLRATRNDRSEYLPSAVEQMASSALDKGNRRLVGALFIKSLWREPRGRAFKERLAAVVLDACQRGDPASPRAIADMLQARPGKGLPDADVHSLRQARRFVAEWAARSDRGIAGGGLPETA